MLRRAGLWVAVLLGVYAVAVFLLFSFAGETLELFAELPWWTLPGFMLFALGGFAVRFLRWLLLSKTVRLQVPAPALAKVYLGGFLMNLTPGRVGELWRAWILRCGWKVGYDRGLSLVFCERFFDLNALLLFAVFGAVLGPAFVWMSAVAFGGLCFVVGLVALPGWGRALIKAGWAVTGKRWPRLFAGALLLCRNLGRLVQWRLYAGLLALSCLAWSFEVFAIAFFADFLGAQVSLQEGAAVLGLSNIAGVLTYLPGGMGGQEAAMGFLLIGAGMTLATAPVLVLIMRLSTLWFSALLGLPFFIALTRRHAGAVF